MMTSDIAHSCVGSCDSRIPQGEDIVKIGRIDGIQSNKSGQEACHTHGIGEVV